MNRRRAIVDVRVSLISTGDFLRELEAEGLIQSADHILDAATSCGRDVDRQRQATSDIEVRRHLREQLQRRHDAPKTH